MLFLVATPIGNLQDITFRAIETLKNCDYILCEDTRHSLTLLKHYGIAKPLKSFHKFSEFAKEDHVIEDLRQGKQVALISDAGTPGISDPGALLAKRCIQENIPVTSIPGPCAAITALTVSGLATDLFQFFGFLPKKAKELKSTLSTILAYSGTTICYESPFRLLEVLKTLSELAENRLIVVCRELTKKFEEIKRGTAKELLDYFETHPLKGEIVLLISGEHKQEINWESLTPEEHVAYLEKTYQLTRNEAIKMAANMRGTPKRTLYNLFHK